MKVSIEQGNLLDARADAFLFPIDKDFSIHTGWAAAFRDAEGPSLLSRIQAAARSATAPVGSVFKVVPQRLQARLIFVLVNCDMTWTSIKPDTISRALKTALQQAERDGIAALAMPLLGHPMLNSTDPLVATEMMAAILHYARLPSPGPGVRSIRILLPTEKSFMGFVETAKSFYNKSAASGQLPNRDPSAQPHPALGLETSGLPANALQSKPSPDDAGRLGTNQAGPLADCRIVAICASDSGGLTVIKNGLPKDSLTLVPSLSRGMELIKETKPELVLLDHDSLYLGDNIELVMKNIRSQGDVNVGTIVMAESYQFDVIMEAVSMSSDAFLAKPVTWPNLKAALLLALDKRKLRVMQTKLLEDLSFMNRMQDQFLSMVSHDLRSPLTVFLGYLELMKDELAGASPRVVRMVELMTTASREMKRLVSDLTDIASMKAGKLKIELAPVETRALLLDIASAFALLAQKRNVSFHADIPDPLPDARLDGGRIRQVLMNLLGNSLKHTPAGNSISLEVALEGRQIALTVADTGAGIAPKDLPKIFEPFYQSAESKVNAKEGLGLGLAICKAIVDMHNGAIKATSDGPGKGTRVEIRIPLGL